MRKQSVAALVWCVGLLAIFAMAACSAFAQNNNSSNRSNSNSNRSGGNNNNNNSNSNSDSDYGEFNSAQDYYRYGYRSVVGGFAIDAENAFRTASQEEVAAMTEEVRSLLAEIPADLDRETPMRKVSLKRLAALLEQSAAQKTAVPDSALYLGGLTGIDYVVAVPEENDIYLAGPAEGWTLNAEGVVVGKTSGKPILLLEDLLTVFRAWNTKTPEVITCSIDPSQEAIARMTALAMTADPTANEAAGREAMGLMNVSFTGIPADSRMARVLAAADYKMKTLSLGFENSPLEKFPSYFSMLKRGSGSFGQRFWISPEYSTLKRGSDSLAWNLSATRVKTMTEREYFGNDGSRRQSGKKDANAIRWAETMTKRYGELAEAVPVFAEAKNCMDVALVVALVFMENLPNKAGCDLKTLTDAAAVPTPVGIAPEKVPSDSLCRTLNGRGEMVSVTGGVSINPFEAIEKNVELDAALDAMAQKIAFAGENWYAD